MQRGAAVGFILNIMLAGHLLALPDAATWGAFASGDRESWHLRQAGPLSWDGARRDSTHQWDALSYVADMQLEFSPPSWHATVAMDFACLEALDTLDFHLRGYEINSLMVNGIPAVYQRSADRVLVDVRSLSFQAGDSARLIVSYAGAPVWENGLGLSVGGQIAYTLSDPWGTRNWLACYDEPFDKARWSLNLRCDHAFSVLANGNLTGVTDHGDGTRTWSYRHDVPMSSYLASVVCGSLTVLEDSWQGLPLRWFTYPQHVAQMWQAVSHKDSMFQCFTDLWGAYPFDSYAMGEAPIYGGMGGMEHQSCTTIGSGIIAGGLSYESIIAHELSHMWWGDSVTPVDFQHVWLNEGWATYAEAYFYQRLAGGEAAAFDDYLAQLQQTYLAWDSQFEPIFDPPDDDLFTVNQYEKAACVLHMLRQIMGEEPFHEAQRLWQAEHRHGCVDTAEYQAAMEAACGQNLDWFFRQWIYSGGYPTYRTVTEFRDEGDSCRVHLTVNQSHPRLTEFRALVPVRIQSSLFTLDTLIWVESSSSQFSWRMPGHFDSLVFNHRHPVLCRVEVQAPVEGPPIWHVIDTQLDDSQGGNGDGDLSQGEWAWLSLTLENTGGWDSELEFSLTSNDVAIEGMWPLVPEAGGGTQVLLPTGHVALSGLDSAEPRWLSAVLRSSSASGPAQELPVLLPGGDPWLLALTPAEQPDIGPWVLSELDSLACFSDAQAYTAAGLPAPAAAHRGMLILGGDVGNRLTNNQIQWVQDLVESGHNVLLSGQDLLDSLAGPWGLGCLEVLSLDVADRVVDGEPGSPLAGLSALLVGASGANNQVDPSSFTWQDCGMPHQVLARYRNSQAVAMTLIEPPQGGRAVVAGFGLEAISGMAGTNRRRDWLEALVPLLDPLSSLPREAGGEGGPTYLPQGLELGAPYPNPANLSMQIRIALPASGPCRLRIFDVLGNERATVFNQHMPRGTHRIAVDGGKLPSGLYFLQLEGAGQRQAQKWLLVK